MRTLVIRHFNEARKILPENSDILLTEQQKIDLKIRYRKLFVPLTGVDRSNPFFTEEQLFRKRIREGIKAAKKRIKKIKV